MNSSNSIDDSSNEHCKYDIKCKKAITNHCQGCGQMFCMDHYLEHQKKLEKHFKYIMSTLDLVNQKWKSLASEIATDAVLDLINQIYEYSLKSNKIEKTAITIQQQLQDLINENKQDLKKQSIRMINGSNFDENDYLENDIERLKQDIEKLQLKLEEISNDNQKRVSEEQSHIDDNQSEIIKSPSLNNDSKKEKYPVRLVANNSRKLMANKSNDTPTLPRLLIRQSSSSNSDSRQNEDVLVKTENETHQEEAEDDDDDDEEEMTVFLDSNTELHVNHKVRFSNNIVRWLRGPFKAIVHGTLHAADVCAQRTRIREAILQAVKKRIAEQNQIPMKQQTTTNSILPTFTEITSDWKLEGANPNQGYSSSSLWIRDPQGRRVLIKIQQLPLCAANEWLAYVLGRALDLPVNEVQIAIYENNLVTLHTDVQNEDEKTITFMELPKKKRKALITNPIMECMDIFDHIIQNVDRNQQNILITIPKTADIDDDNDEMKVKVHLIDHSSSFGMGKVSGISTIASKFHTNHLAVCKFDPIQQSKQFEQYLNQLPAEDRPLISKTLNRFASITNDQFDNWIAEIQDLLSSSQYNRVHSVLRRQRDIAKRFTTEWGISPRSSSIKSNETEISL